MTTLSGVASAPLALDAVSSNVSLSEPLGIVNVGLAVLAPVRVTFGPPVCFQAKPVASVDFVPSSVILPPWTAAADRGRRSSPPRRARLPGPWFLTGLGPGG